METITPFSKEHKQYRSYDFSGFNGAIVVNINCIGNWETNKLIQVIMNHGFITEVTHTEINIVSLTMLQSKQEGYYTFYDSHYKNNIRLYKNGFHLEFVNSDKTVMPFFSLLELESPAFYKGGFHD